MRKCKSTDKKVYIYDIKDKDGTPLELMNVVTYKQNSFGESVIDSVITFIGRHDRDEFVAVGSTNNLSEPGTIFKYSSYVREQEMMMRYYLEFYHQNLNGKVYTKGGGQFYLDNH